MRDRIARLVIFDCDGVLVDSEMIAGEVLRDAVAEAGLALDAETVQRRFQGLSLGGVVASLARDGIDFHGERQSRMAAALRSRFEQDLRPVAGMPRLLEGLDVPSCVASSSGAQRLAHALRLTGLAGRFGPHVFSADDVEHPKPAPDIFLLASRAMGVVPERCLVVEDSALGIEAARAAGMDVVAFAGASHSGGEDYRAALSRLGAPLVTSADALRDAIALRTSRSPV